MSDRLHVVFLWHMHQPYYVNPLTKMAMMPWVRLHAVKGYLDMIDVATRYGELRTNFNFTPVLVKQLVELKEKRVTDLWESWSRIPAKDLHDDEKKKLLENFFKIHWDNLIKPYPRYHELLQLRGESWDLGSVAESISHFTAQDFLDLQTWYNLAWCGFSARKRFPELAELIAKGKGFTEQEKNRVLDIHHEIIATLLDLYRDAQGENRIEVTTTPFFHPIMPLVYDTDFAKRCMPGRALPQRFSAPEDVLKHLELAQEQHERVFGRKAEGLWPSEGSVAPELIPLFQKVGIRYICTDEENLFRSLKNDPEWSTRNIDHLELFQGWRCEFGGSHVHALFRERPLSDFIGFNASRNPSDKSADYMAYHLGHLADVSKHPQRVVTLALDGENAWETFPDGGETFLCMMYEKILADNRLQTRLMRDYFDEFQGHAPIRHLHTGSWIGGDFDIWIGDAEENQGWEQVKATREFLVKSLAEKSVPEDKQKEAWMEIYAAEGSDWFWWYGPDFQTDCDFLFDELFRTHLQNVYRLLECSPPPSLDVPIRRRGEITTFISPSAHIEPSFDPKSTGYYDWLGAGAFDIKKQQTAMFQSDRVGDLIAFGFNANHFFLKFHYSKIPEEIVLLFHSPTFVKIKVTTRPSPMLDIHQSEDGVNYRLSDSSCVRFFVEPSIQIGLPVSLLGWKNDGSKASFTLQVLQGGIEKERYPEKGLIEFYGASHEFELNHWFV